MFTRNENRELMHQFRLAERELNDVIFNKTLVIDKSTLEQLQQLLTDIKNIIDQGQAPTPQQKSLTSLTQFLGKTFQTAVEVNKLPALHQLANDYERWGVSSENTVDAMAFYNSIPRSGN